ncbi:hypothetical protein H6758_04795 [Candidatus Nomurabacteria bacterium]|nr:hypothetical protein [Candidatus Nomurabacteria bacterium]
MTGRQEQILRLVVENYIHSVEPIGSKFLGESADLDVSGATIRNELRLLEEEGYLTHPHTSAGRIPTELGYQYYVSNLITQRVLEEDQQKTLQTILNQFPTQKEKVKGMAKFAAHYARNAVIIGFDRKSLYYTGMSNLFSQPEFQDYQYTVNVSSVFDECEAKIPQVVGNMPKDEIKVFIGQENPFGKICSALCLRFDDEGLFILLGPMRMDYEKNIALFQKIHELTS